MIKRNIHSKNTKLFKSYSDIVSIEILYISVQYKMMFRGRIMWDKCTLTHSFQTEIHVSTHTYPIWFYGWCKLNDSLWLSKTNLMMKKEESISLIHKRENFHFQLLINFIIYFRWMYVKGARNYFHTHYECQNIWNLTSLYISILIR